MTAYDQLYPSYVEISALSQIRPLEGPLGGRAGHGVMYLKGVCRVEGAQVPLLRMCDPDAREITDSECGVGISVDKIFKNVNWVAIPGKRLFFSGNLAGDARLTEEGRRAAVAAVRDLGLFRGVEIHEEYLREKPPGEDREAWVAAGAAGTDYALNFGRTLFSAKLPVTRPMLEKMIAYLNGLNLKYASGQADYNWSGYADNCVHTIHNSLAAAGIWRPWPVAAIKLLNLFNLAVPANEFIDLATLANEFPLESFSRIYFDRVKRRELWEYGWLPTRHGALLETIPVHRDNALYDTGFKMLVLEPAFIFGRTRRRGNRMLDDPRYTDIGENLRYFRARYERILEEGRAWRDRTLREMRYRIARRKYYAYIEAQIEDADRKLAQLGKEGA